MEKWILRVCFSIVAYAQTVLHAAPAVTILPESRCLDFNDYAQTNNAPTPKWVHEGPPVTGLNSSRALLSGTNHFHRTGWVLHSCRTGCSGYMSGARIVPPLSPETVPIYPAMATNLAANLRNDSGAYVESPVFTNGVGTFYFDAINGVAGNPTAITVDVSTDSVVGANGLEYVWQELDKITLDAATMNDFCRYSRLLNYRQWVKIRIRRTGTVYSGSVDANFTVIDNIRVSSPPSDVSVTKTDDPFEPGYPSIGTNLTVRCYVSNADTNVPTDSRSVKMFYRWRYLDQAIDAWRTNTMSYVVGTGDGAGNGERYEAVLPAFAEVGDLEYYFVCDFGGYVYQSPDCTGTGLAGTSAGSPGGYPYATEALSPKTLRRGGAEREFYTRLRPYRSNFGTLCAETDQLGLNAPVPMMLTGPNEWRAMVPVGATGLTNLTWRFKGEGEYFAGTGTASTGTVYWSGLGDVATGGRVPYGGACVRTNDDTARLNVAIDSGAYAMLTLNTDTLQYFANRTEYQNFNRWPAPDAAFSESNGQIEKQRFVNTFDAWPTNEDEVFEQSFVGVVSETNVYHSTPFTTIGFGTACNAKYVSERTFDSNPAAVFNARNLALRLKGGDGDLGYTYNAASQLPDGLKKITFRGRLGQTSDNGDVVYKKDATTNFNYLVRATAAAVNANSLSPETPSISLVAYYSNADNFYEFRITQIPDPNATAAVPTDKRVHYELYKWMNGTAALLAQASASLSVSGTPLTSISDAAPVEMRLYNATTSSTLIRCKAFNTDNVLAYTDNSSPFQSGTYGFVSAECRASLSSVVVYGTTTDAAQTGAATYPLRSYIPADFNTDVLSWAFPVNRYVARNDVVPMGIYSILPAQQLGIYVQNTDYGSGADPNASDWNLIGVTAISNFTYQTSTVTVNSWQSRFVKLKVLAGDADVVVDGLSVYSWHGKTVPSGALVADWTGWKATEAWVVSNSTSAANVVELDHWRANPALAQAVRSELLTNGLGVMEFDYKVIRPPAKITVQYACEGSPDDWFDISSLIVSNVVGWTHLSSYLGLSEPGYFRVLNERSDGYTNAWFDVNDVTVWDEPYVSNTSWRVYNAKITNTDTNRIYLDESKACFLNNSTTNEASPPQNWFQPFLQSPTLPKGLGTLSFYARAYGTNESATVYVYATTNGWSAPTNQWFLLTQFNNITNRFYRLYMYSSPGGRKDVNAIQMRTQNGGSTKRVCLEEVAVTEPAPSGFDIVNVKLLKWENGAYAENAQPLVGEDVDVEARIANQQFTPSNIVMWVSCYVGTNVWGAGNWPEAQTVTKRMHPADGDPTLYRTRHDNGGVIGLEADKIGPIQNQDEDAVVQYHVWATYMGGIELRKEQETFDNPSWYYPVDLNAKYAAQGWSPYYFVYNVRRNAVWINEVNAVDYIASGSDQAYNNPYIEIAVPAWLDLAGWSVDLVRYAYVTVATITIPSGLPTHAADTNGYYFFVIGDVYPLSGAPALPRKDLGYLSFASKIPWGCAGGLRLKRPQGMYEQAIAYDWNNFSNYGAPFSGPDFAANDPQGLFVYVGRENNGGSLGRTGSNTLSTVDSTNTWMFPQTWTPGGPNDGQLISINRDDLLSGVSNVFVTSVMNLFKGTQNGRRVASHRIKKHVGDSTNIVYQIDDWYRLYSVQVDNTEQLTASEAAQGEQGYTLQLPNLQDDVIVNVNVQLRSDLSAYESTPNILGWMLGFLPEGQLVPSYYNDRTLSMTELYWFDINPTMTNYFEFETAGFAMDTGTNLYLTIRMSVSNEVESARVLTSFQGGAVLKLQAKENLSDSEWILVRQYNLSDASFVSNHVCHVYVPNPFAVLISEIDPRQCYIRWKIEMEDPRVGVAELINSTQTGPWSP